MASLYIKDSETAALAAELATRLGITKAEAVRDSLLRRKAELIESEPKEDWLVWMKRYRAEHPLPQPTGKLADKAFFDELWGED